MDSPPLGTFVKGPIQPDGSFTYNLESEIVFEVTSLTPKELSLKAQVLHGAETVLAGETIEDDDPRVLDEFADQGEYGICECATFLQ